MNPSYNRKQVAVGEEILRTVDFAIKAHGDQMRKGEPIPYVSHPVRVALNGCRHGLPVEAIQAAILHDVVEDTDVEQHIVHIEFGWEVAILVHLVTKWWGDSATEPDVEAKKAEYYGKIAQNPHACAIKLLDRIDNLQSMINLVERNVADHGKPKTNWPRNYLRKTYKEFEQIKAGALKLKSDHSYEPLVDEFNATVKQLHDALTAAGVTVEE